ncbi:phospholipase D family protein [bacterium]|nr:phospholipase D family protein [bacterium]
MIDLSFDLLTWVAGALVALALASWWAHRSYRRFLQKARGPASQALSIGLTTPLDAIIEPLSRHHPGQSGLMSLLDNADAFAVRAEAAAQAGRSLDLMYYIWRLDLAGQLLLDALLAAADRGVRVRLLLDDVNVQSFDRSFLALSQHPMIEVRLFNPTRNRGAALRRAVEMLLGLSRFNRRMHGKLWIADGRLAVVGGRNIGDTYFGVPDGGRTSIDADVMLVGPKVAEVEAVFDAYWNLGLSLPIAALWPGFKVSGARFRRRLRRRITSAASRRFMTASLAGRSAETILTGRLHWTASVTVLADPPEKAYGAHSAPWISTTIATILNSAEHEVRLITPYFVPGRVGAEGLARLAGRGAKLLLMTNALSATDKVLVYGAYRHYRGPLLKAGARIFEFSKPARPGGKREVLHSKIFVIDGRRALVGSPNFDMRSAFTNTELGLLFEEPAIVAELSTFFAKLSEPDNAYEVTLGNAGLRWSVTRPGLPATMTVEPEASGTRRAVSWLVGRLPIQSYL